MNVTQEDIIALALMLVRATARADMLQAALAQEQAKVEEFERRLEIEDAPLPPLIR